MRGTRNRPLSTTSKSLVAEVPDPITLEEAKYPPRHILSVDALAQGNFEAFTEFFRLSHPEFQTQTETAQSTISADDDVPGKREMQQSEYIMLKDLLCVAENSLRDGNADAACAAYEAVASMFDQIRNFNETIHFLSKSMDLARERGIVRLEAAVLVKLAAVYEKMGERDVATQSYEEALRLSGECGDIALQQRARTDLLASYLARAQELEARGNNTGAISLYQKAVDLAAATGDPAAVGRAHFRLGTALESQDSNSNDALDHFSKYLQCALSLDDYHEKVSASDALASACGRRNRWEEAEKYLRQSADIARDANDQYVLAKAAGALGSCLVKEDKHAEAAKAFEEQFAIAMALEDKVLQDNARIQLGIAKAQAQMRSMLAPAPSPRE